MVNAGIRLRLVPAYGPESMKSQFLAQKIRQGSLFGLNCSMLPDVVVADSESGCLTLFKEKLDHLLKTTGREYVNKFKGGNSNNGIVNCPEGFVLLPLDAWHCKYDKAICALQASIDLSHKDIFEKYCRNENKEGIYRAVQQQAYTGFHHVPGRYLCPSCDCLLRESKQNFKYHYPWELYPLWECINFEDQTVICSMNRLGISSSVGHSKVCASCFLKLMRQILPNSPDIDDLFVLEMDFFPQ